VSFAIALDQIQKPTWLTDITNQRGREARISTCLKALSDNGGWMDAEQINHVTGYHIDNVRIYMAKLVDRRVVERKQKPGNMRNRILWRAE